MPDRIVDGTKCGVCGKLHDEEQRADVAFRAALCGAVAYAICPGCGLEMKKPFPKGWTRWVDGYIEELQRAEQAAAASPASPSPTRPTPPRSRHRG